MKALGIVLASALAAAACHKSDGDSAEHATTAEAPKAESEPAGAPPQEKAGEPPAAPSAEAPANDSGGKPPAK